MVTSDTQSHKRLRKHFHAVLRRIIHRAETTQTSHAGIGQAAELLKRTAWKDILHDEKIIGIADDLYHAMQYWESIHLSDEERTFHFQTTWHCACPDVQFSINKPNSLKQLLIMNTHIHGSKLVTILAGSILGVLLEEQAELGGCNARRHKQ